MNVLLAGVVGSTAYGLAGPDSDVDRLGMFALPTIELVGLGKPQLSRVAKNPDSTWHEAGKAVGLFLAGNPTATELPARSDIVLRCVNRTAGMFDSYVAAMSVINHLCTRLGLALGDAARERLAHIERLHDDYGDLRR